MQMDENRDAPGEEMVAAASPDSLELTGLPQQSERSIEIEISASYPSEVKKELAGGDDDPSRTHDYKLSWRRTETHVFVSAQGKKMCHVGLVRQTVGVSGVSLDVAGVGGVLVRNDARGHGYGHIAMEAAEEFVAREMKIGFLLLFCREAVRSWYDALGWRKVLGATWAEQPNGEIVLPLASMWKSLNGARWPDGDVYLHSRPW
jgi:GNAT superfamily N-acetyltransferase